MTIWKLQRPLNPGDTLPVYAYTKGRAQEFLLEQSPEVLALFGSSFKIFIEAEVIDGTLVGTKVVAEQGW